MGNRKMFPIRERGLTVWVSETLRGPCVRFTKAFAWDLATALSLWILVSGMSLEFFFWKITVFLSPSPAGVLPWLSLFVCLTNNQILTPENGAAKAEQNRKWRTPEPNLFETCVKLQGFTSTTWFCSFPQDQGKFKTCSYIVTQLQLTSLFRYANVSICISAHRKTIKPLWYRKTIKPLWYLCFFLSFWRKHKSGTSFYFHSRLWEKHSAPHSFCLNITLMTSLVKHGKPCRWPRIRNTVNPNLIYDFKSGYFGFPRPMSPFFLKAQVFSWR